MIIPYIRKLNCTTLAINGNLLSLATLAMLGMASVTSAEEGVNIPALMFQPSVNLVVSVGDVEESKDFYGEILKLTPMANLHRPGGLVMTRCQVGTTEIKQIHSDATKKSEPLYSGS